MDREPADGGAGEQSALGPTMDLTKDPSAFPPTAPPPAPTPLAERDLRVSDAEREHVGQLLQRAVGQGMLSLGEFTERMDTALAAKTRGELNSVLIDLPGVRLVGQPEAVHAPGAASGGGPPATADPGSVIRGRMSSLTRSGPWQVPPILYTETRMSSLTLDFSEAIMSTQIVRVELNDVCSAITIVVPSAATVDAHGIDLIGSTVSNRVRTGPPMGPLHLVVRGRMRFGSVTARHPTSWRSHFGLT